MVMRCVPALESVGEVDHTEARIHTLKDVQCLGQLGTRQVDQLESSVVVVVVAMVVIQNLRLPIRGW
jgi:hypothetical protein